MGLHYELVWLKESRKKVLLSKDINVAIGNFHLVHTNSFMIYWYNMIFLVRVVSRWLIVFGRYSKKGTVGQSWKFGSHLSKL